MTKKELIGQVPIKLKYTLPFVLLFSPFLYSFKRTCLSKVTVQQSFGLPKNQSLWPTLSTCPSQYFALSLGNSRAVQTSQSYVSIYMCDKLFCLVLLLFQYLSSLVLVVESRGVQKLGFGVLGICWDLGSHETWKQ